MDFLIDAKIMSIKFDFDASNILKNQNLIFEVEKLEDKLVSYTLQFIDVSSFQFFLDVREKNLSPSPLRRIRRFGFRTVETRFGKSDDAA